MACKNCYQKGCVMKACELWVMATMYLCSEYLRTEERGVPYGIDKKTS
jgi:hypothetical protein